MTKKRTALLVASSKSVMSFELVRHKKTQTSAANSCFAWNNNLSSCIWFYLHLKAKPVLSITLRVNTDCIKYKRMVVQIGCSSLKPLAKINMQVCCKCSHVLCRVANDPQLFLDKILCLNILICFILAYLQAPLYLTVMCCRHNCCCYECTDHVQKLFLS